MAEGKPNFSTRVLVVDDEPDILYVCEKALEKQYLVSGFSSPEDALEHFKAHCAAVDLVLTDVRMPTMSGFELAREIRMLRKDIPIVFMSAHEIVHGEYESAFPAAEGIRVLSKPFNLSTLAQFISKHATSRE
ncbi:MAG: response regulator [Nitrososphaera sp.]|jgi:two-component system cell cycle sensor histidine kinase/response regulator CckA